VWLAKLTERGMLRPSFVPPGEIREPRDYTRLRVDLTRERSRHAQRLEKLLEDADQVVHRGQRHLNPENNAVASTYPLTFVLSGQRHRAARLTSAR
jgi:hypothetical protein